MSDTSVDQRLAAETSAGNKSAPARSSAAATAEQTDTCNEEQPANTRDETTNGRARAPSANSSDSSVIEHNNTSCPVPDPATSRRSTDNDDRVDILHAKASSFVSRVCCNSVMFYPN